MRAFIFMGLLALGCKAEPVIPYHQYAHPQVLRFMGPLPEPETNRFKQETIRLGKMLFYETKLSTNNKVNCATCHDQTKAFADGVALTDKGASGKRLKRHSPTLINLAFSPSGFFWDGGSTNLESQALGPLLEHDEMGQQMNVTLDKLRNESKYRKAFALAFADKEVSVGNLLKAVAQFVRTLVSFNSRYDRFLRNETGIALTEAEAHGRNLFTAKCAPCHEGMLMTDMDFHNNGIDEKYPEADMGIHTGRFRITRKVEDIGKFKTPTLRNIAVSAPYMHDGRFASLEAVIDHYSHEVKKSATLDRKIPRGGFHFSAAEKAAIKSFLLTLTDDEFLKRREYHVE